MDEVPAETVDEAIERALLELGAERRPVAGTIETLARGRLFAAVTPGRLEVLLEPAVAAAALRTPSVARSSRGSGWVAFTPPVGSTSRLDVDRAVAWLRLAHRAASGGA